MFTKRVYSAAMMLRWTRQELVLFTVMAAIPVFLYDVLGQRWLHLPWLPSALVGTAVAFILGFQNNATYDRIWDALQPLIVANPNARVSQAGPNRGDGQSFPLLMEVQRTPFAALLLRMAACGDADPVSPPLPLRAAGALLPRAAGGGMGPAL